MAILFDTQLKAGSILRCEGREVIDIHSEEANHCHPKRVCVLNLLTDKPEAETQWLRGLSYADCDVSVTFFMVESYIPRHTCREYLGKYYRTTSQIMEEQYDGLIVTGADVERYSFETLGIWPELEKIFDWADGHVNATFFSCWASMAAAYHYYGIHKESTGPKISGVYSHTMPHPEHALMNDITAPIYIPQSRYTRPEESEVFEKLTVLAQSENGWPTVYCDDEKRRLFVVGHWEYEPYILKNQYVRDISRGLDPQAPANYFDLNGNIRTDQDWSHSFHLMMRNWVKHYVCWKVG